MKYLIVLLLFCCCEESAYSIKGSVNNNEVMATVYLYLTQDGYPTKIYNKGHIVSIIQYKGERDTIQVPDSTELKARIYHDGDFSYEILTAYDGLYWKLPFGN